MVRHIATATIAAAFFAGCALGGPDESVEGRASAVSAKKLDPADYCDPSLGGFTLDSTNPYFPIAVGWQWTIEGEEDDEEIVQVITILDETEVVAGVTTRVLEEVEFVDDELAEISRNYVVERNGTICYFGEAVDIYEDGVVVSNEGAWRADEPGNGPGILMPADPRPGMRFPTEVAPGVAEDEVKIVAIGPIEVEAGTFTENIRFREYNPLDAGKGYKVYSEGVGIVLDEVLELTDYTSP